MAAETELEEQATDCLETVGAATEAEVQSGSTDAEIEDCLAAVAEVETTATAAAAEVQSGSALAELETQSEVNIGELHGDSIEFNIDPTFDETNGFELTPELELEATDPVDPVKNFLYIPKPSLSKSIKFNASKSPSNSNVICSLFFKSAANTCPS